MKIAIYSRKSKNTDKGESIDNQIHMCKEYALAHFDSPEFFIFQDEGFSGGNMNRPQFQILLEALKKGLYDVLICYRLDRISRNVSDFSSTLELLTKHHIGFVSIKENFDTTTPMGRAMIHISSVFAQLERETIAERIKDNMLELSKTGRWLGGTSPLGYTSKKQAYESGGKVKTYAILERDCSTEHLVKIIFEKYLELGSISKVETYLLQENIKTPNNTRFHSNVIRGLLINPVYCSADKIAYNYFSKLGSIIPDEENKFAGTYGIMPYNRHKNGQAHMKNPPEEWIIAIGQHEPLIDSATWLKVQQQLQRNSTLAFSNAGTSPALLSGLIYCKNCGALMQVNGQSILADGTVSYNYRCTNKLKSRGKICRIHNISQGYILDALIIEHLKEMLNNKTELIKQLNKLKQDIFYKLDTLQEEKVRIQYEIAENTSTISQLIKKLITFNDQAMEKYIQDEVNTLHLRNTLLTKRLDEIKDLIFSKDHSASNIECLFASILDFDRQFTLSTLHQRKTLIRHIVKRIEWDGKYVDIYFFFDKTPI